MPKLKYFIRIVESERGWGQRYETWEYDTFEAAQAAVKKIEKENRDQWNRNHFVPDWYIQVRGGIEVKEV